MKKLFLLSILISLFVDFLFAQMPKVGSKAPTIKADEWINSNFSNTQLKGKTIVLDFWYVHCGPCVAAFPHLNDLVNKYKNDNVVFVAVTFDKKEAVKKFLAQKKVLAYVALDTLKTLNKAYGITAYPSTFVIGADGLIKWQGNPVNLTETVLDGIIGKKEENTVTTSPAFQEPYELIIESSASGLGSAFFNRETELSFTNYTLKEVIGTMLDVSLARIDSVGSFPESRYDITLKINKTDATYEDKSAAFISLLQKHMNIYIKNASKEVELYNVTVKNSDLLKQHVHLSSNKPGWTKSKDELKAFNISLSELFFEMENDYKYILNNGTDQDINFDFHIPFNDFEETKIYLEENYGLLFEKQKRNIEFVTIDYTNCKEF